MSSKIQKRFCITFEDVLSTLERTDIFKNDLTETCAEVVKIAIDLNVEGFLDHNDFMNKLDRDLFFESKLSGKYRHIQKTKRQFSELLRPLKKEYTLE